MASRELLRGGMTVITQPIEGTSTCSNDLKNEIVHT